MRYSSTTRLVLALLGVLILLSTPGSHERIISMEEPAAHSTRVPEVSSVEPKGKAISPSSAHTPVAEPVSDDIPTPSQIPSQVSEESPPDPRFIGCEAPQELSIPESLQAGDIEPRQTLRLPRVDGASPVPPNFAKDIYAWDNQGGEIGLDEYKSYFTAHTYSSDSSALGNLLIARLHQGDIVRVVDIEGRVICYEVDMRTEVLESEYINTVNGQPSNGVMVISVCSELKGKVWTKRTVWFAKVVDPSE